MSKFAFYSMCLSACVLARAVAQEEPPAATSEQQGAIVLRAESEDGGQTVHTFAMSSNGNGDFFSFAPSPGMAFSFGGGDPSEASEFLLNDPGVQKELELLDGQREQIRQMQNAFGKEIKSKIDETMKSGGPDKNRLGEVIDEINKRRKDRLSEILLPHQIDRLKQISLQSNVNQMGLGQALASKALMEQLGIDAEQQAKLKEKAQQLQKELEEKVAKLRADMREELMGELKPEQREKIKELFGKKFEFENQGGPMMLPPRGNRAVRQAPSSGN